jgi:hypothetical protein
MENQEKEVEKVETPIEKKEATPEPSQPKKERTPLEKLRYTKARLEAQIAEEESKNGIVITDDVDDDKPLTKGDLKRIQRDEAKKTALQMASEISDEDERSKVIEYLETRIVPTGNPQKDLQFARDTVNSEKNRQIAEMATKKKNPVVTRSSGTGAPANVEDQFIPTENELAAAAMVGKKTPADIKAFVLKARAKEQQ